MVRLWRLCYNASREDVGQTGIVIFQPSGAPQIMTGLDFVTFDFYHNGTQHLRLHQGTSTDLVVYDDTNVVGFKLLGAILEARIRMYKSLNIEIGWCQFNPTGRKLTGGPGWVVGIGENMNAPMGANSIHDCTAQLFYRHGVDANGMNGDDFFQNGTGVDFYNNSIISTFTADSFAGHNHQDFIQSIGKNWRIWNNYFENAANFTIFFVFETPTEGLVIGPAQIFNNVFNYADPVLTSQPSASIQWGMKPGSAPVKSAVFNNCYIFNNTFRGGKNTTVLGYSGQSNTFNNFRIQNNLRYDNAGPYAAFGTTSAIINTNNAIANSASDFVNVGAGNFALTASATEAINLGTTAGGVFPLSRQRTELGPLGRKARHGILAPTNLSAALLLRAEYLSAPHRPPL